MTARVLVSCVQMQRELHKYEVELKARGIELVVPEIVQQLSEAQLVEIMPDIDGVIAGDDEFTEQAIAAAPRLRIISKWGVGTDGIDKAAAQRLGVTVTNTPGVFADEVADVAMGYIVLLARGLHVIDREVRAGRWHKIEGETLRGKTIGIVGLGSIGRALAVRAAAFGMLVTGSDPVRDACAAARDVGVTVVPLTDAIGASDYIALCCPLTPETRHLLNEASLATVRPGVKVVNVARGPLIHETALVDALQRGTVGGAALDVFESEPLGPDNPLLAFDSVIVGSHNSSNTKEAVERTSRLALQNLLEHL